MAQLTLEQKTNIYKEQIEYLCTLTKNYDHKFESNVQAEISDKIKFNLTALQKSINLEVTGKEY